MMADLEGTLLPYMADNDGMNDEMFPGSDVCTYTYGQLLKTVHEDGFATKEEMLANVTRSCYDPGNLTCAAFLYDLTGEERINNLVYIMPAAHYEYEFVIPYAVIVLSLVVFGFFGNFFTVIVILRNKVLQSTSHYLLSLALSDMLLLVLTGPTEVLVELRYWPWTYTSFFCHARFFLIEFCLFTTVLHITAFTIERYVAICHPIKAKAFISTTRAIKFIIVIWVVSFLISIPMFLSHGLIEACTGISESTVCQIKSDWDRPLMNMHIFSATVLFLLPMTLIIVLYSLIARVLFGVDIKVSMRRSSSTRGRGRLNGNIKAKEDKEDQVITMRKQVVKMLVVIAASFFFCWFPFHLIRIIPIFGMESLPVAFQQIYFKGLYHFSIVLLYANSAINPILYNVMSARFRRAFQQTILCREVHLTSLFSTLTTARCQPRNSTIRSSYRLAPRWGRPQTFSD